MLVNYKELATVLVLYLILVYVGSYKRIESSVPF